ncbi:DNA-3-methyladenine glycosylase I [Ciceribacter ferrooxidans]|uniref:3-methyladenine DNA glycosylase n=1 Tax=Ciceribacter ferrooxidans TaxID=2509717 RepID=A0A4Q2T5R8_9HYPH|nr:DNA-3-methyladenine glycosylase I [Ciceribacter ferrooxidans]RYC14002.1 3-methyladenine DNA glycosylase [Ciceribacter ferrooxidans]
MRSFDEIYAIAAERKGGANALEVLLERPQAPDKIAAIADDRWLSSMARSLFEAGFNWKVIDAKWQGFEAAFEDFNPHYIASCHDEDVDRLLTDSRIVRNGAKIMAVIDNARFICDLASEHGSAGRFFADWPETDFAGLLELLSKRGARLGGVTGQRMLRRLGYSSFILSSDVIARLTAEGVIEGVPGGRRAMQAVQDAFNEWLRQSGRSLTEISRILAMSI